MIHLELLKRLKDAGYPQTMRMGGRLVRRDDEMLFAPYINDLILRLGDIQLTFIPHFYRSRLRLADSTVETWTAHVETADGEGNTREEALAELWINLHSGEGNQ